MGEKLFSISISPTLPECDMKQSRWHFLQNHTKPFSRAHDPSRLCLIQRSENTHEGFGYSSPNPEARYGIPRRDSEFSSPTLPQEVLLVNRTQNEGSFCTSKSSVRTFSSLMN